MSEIGDAINEIREELADASEEFMADVCNLWGPTFVDGGSAGDSETTGPIASNIPCGYKEGGPGGQIVVGGQAYAGSHQLKLPRTTATIVITPKHQIKVQARGDTSELVFEQPVIIQKGVDPLLTVVANLVQQGFQQ